MDSLSNTTKTRWSHSLLAAIVFGITVLIFSGTFTADFVEWDDDINLYNNSNIKSLNSANLSWIFTDYQYVRRYMPLGWLGWAVNYEFFGPAPWSFHLFNVLIHAVCAVLLFYILGRLARFIVGRDVQETLVNWSALLGALLWAVHPLRTEMVAWASGRLYCQAALFLFASILLYLKYAEQKKPWMYGASLAAFGCSLLTYPIAISAVIFFLILDFYPMNRLRWAEWKQFWSGPDYRKVWFEKIPFAGLVALVFGATLFARVNATGIWEAPASMAQFGIFERVMQAFYIYAYYVWKPFLPIGLMPVYDTLVFLKPASLPFLLSAVGVLTATCFLWFQRTRWPGLWVAWVSYLLLMVPLLGLTEHPHFPNDRYSVFCSVLLSVIASVLLCTMALKSQRSSKLILGMGGAILLTLGSLTAKQCTLWQNSETLFSHMIETLGTSPYRADIQRRLASVYNEKGQPEKAIALYKDALSIWPNQATLLNSVALILVENSKVKNGKQAIEFATRACKATRFENPVHVTTLAAAYAEAGQFEQAVDLTEKAIVLARKQNEANLLRINNKLLEYFRNGKTYYDLLSASKG